MAPELRGGQSRFLGLPDQFDIHYMFLSKDGIRDRSPSRGLGDVYKRQISGNNL